MHRVLTHPRTERLSPGTSAGRRGVGLGAWAAAVVFVTLAAAGWTTVRAAASSAPGAGLGWGTGGLRVTPTRVVLEGRRRGAELTLVNTGSAPATYRISLVHMRMDESGAMSEIDSAGTGEAFADSLLRFSPRQVELGPGEAQTVRIQLRIPPGLAEGEYRSHLVFRQVSVTAAPVDSPGTGAGPGEVRIGLTPVFGVALPVIVRHGATWARVALAEARLDRPSASDTSGAVSLVLMRSGTRSVYGDLTVVRVPERGRPQTIGAMRGVAVYMPNSLRRARIPLWPVPHDDLLRGRLRVFYRDPGAPDSVLGETELALP